MTLFQSVEEIINGNSEGWLDVLLQNYSVSIRVVKPTQSIHRTVYGNEAGDESFSEAFQVDGILTSDDFFPADAHSAGSFQEGWLYVRAAELVAVGDRVEVVRKDSRTRRYKVESQFSLGVSTSVFKRFRVSALGD